MNLPSTTNARPSPVRRRYTHTSLFDDLKEDPNPQRSQKQPKGKPRGGLTVVKEQENTTNESSSGGPGAAHGEQGAGPANDQQASPPPQANNRSFRGRLRAIARRIRDKAKKARDDFKEKTSKSVIPHH